MKKKINFCVVGPQRTSTSWIYEKLLKSNDLNLPTKVKETFFFDNKYAKGFKYYFSLFEIFNHQNKTGEIAPTYFHSTESISRIYDANPNCKIIIIYRDPIEKSISLYKHHYRKGRVGKNFIKAIKKMPEIIETGRYSVYNKLWIDTFKKENVLILNYKELIKKPQVFINRASDFLEISPILLDEDLNKKINKSTVPKFYFLAKISAFIVSFLRKYDLHFIVELGKKMGLKSVYSGGEDNKNFDNERIWLKDKFLEKDFLFKTDNN